MVAIRIKVATEKAELVRRLRTEVFQTYAEVITFAAVVGFHYQRRLPLGETSRKDPDPIPLNQFKDAQIIDLIAVAHEQDAKVLMHDEDHEQMRANLFQEYANGGLQILEEKLRGVDGYLNHILLMLMNQQQQSETDFGIDLDGII